MSAFRRTRRHLSAHLRFQNGNSCTQMRRWIIEKFQHQRVTFEGPLDDSPLNTCAAAMDEPHFTQPGGVGLVQVLFHYGGDVAGRKRVKVDVALDGNPKWVLILHSGIGRFLVADGNFGLDAAANRKVADDGHPARLAGGDEVVENLIRHVFVENAFVAELDKVVFEGLQFDTQAVRDIRDANLAEIG
jgi:hypothetical protein